MVDSSSDHFGRWIRRWKPRNRQNRDMVDDILGCHHRRFGPGTHSDLADDGNGLDDSQVCWLAIDPLFGDVFDRACLCGVVLGIEPRNSCSDCAHSIFSAAG